MKKALIIGLVAVVLVPLISSATLGIDWPWNKPTGRSATSTIVDVLWGGNGRSAALVYFVREDDPWDLEPPVEYYVNDCYLWDEGEESPNDVGLGMADQWAPI